MSDPFFESGTGRPRLRLESADYELVWPRALLLQELTTLRDSADGKGVMIERLLEEAFLGAAPVEDYRHSTSLPGRSLSRSLRFDYVAELLTQVPQLREHRRPGSLWSRRHKRDPETRSEPTRTPAQVREAFAHLISSLMADGYFARTFPKICVDDPDGVEIDPNVVLADWLGARDLWPLQPGEWDADTFYDLIEVFHDLAARPRTRNGHPWNGCGWHFGDFATDVGRAVYRWRVNELLATGGIDLRLAENGEDIGRLVRQVDDARADLVRQALATSEPDAAARVQHAIALFRGREATTHDKKSAVVTLAGILEERRELIRARIGSQDEGALFGIANKFALRHQRRDQQGNYDPVFLDWIFWWYLATVELTDRLLARPS
ncbi:hypothetical protein NQK81_02490 [Amycolatopsis roodepoortensis]|uniref:hypothetical protein n=1 Tax=Amycolatopsis roodepoortensis TaxID=700274 RepID=UPI00214BD4A2|nr:hypothetical protein [Amycolatopsis roodepoortensis]UUV32342.1 hypothetical protein NQK81_02490 [Amycolatopsis roodepoortensis]